MPSVAIVEDHLLLAQTLRAALLRSDVSAEIVTADTPDALVAALLTARPDLVLLDLDLGAFGDGTRLIRPLTHGGLRVLVVTGLGDRESAALAYEQGAFGYQSKAMGFDALLARIGQALRSATPLDGPERTDLLIELGQRRAERERTLAPFRRLTQRECDTLAALSEGRAVTQIAHDWVVSEATVRSHVRALLTKLDVPSQLAAVSLAVRCGWSAEP